MRRTILPMFAVILATATTALSTPAATMELREAIKRCDASAGCTYTLDKSGATIFGPKGGTVSCPPDGGQCQVLNHAGAKTKPPGGVKGVLSGRATPIPAGAKQVTEKPVVKTNIHRAQADIHQTNMHQTSMGGGSGGKKH